MCTKPGEKPLTAQLFLTRCLHNQAKSDEKDKTSRKMRATVIAIRPFRHIFI